MLGFKHNKESPTQKTRPWGGRTSRFK